MVLLFYLFLSVIIKSNINIKLKIGVSGGSRTRKDAGTVRIWSVSEPVLTLLGLFGVLVGSPVKMKMVNGRKCLVCSEVDYYFQLLLFALSE